MKAQRSGLRGSALCADALPAPKARSVRSQIERTTAGALAEAAPSALVSTLGLLLALLLSPAAHAGAFIFADGSAPNEITHPIGYVGVGGPRTVTVCLNPSGVPGGNVALVEATVLKVVATWNAQRVAERNLGLGSNNDLPSNQFDFESVLLHEVGHCLGLAHPNLASESGLNDPQANGTKSAVGSNGSFNVAAGADGLFGSFDDARGDDVNLYWYRRNLNRPLEFPATIDASTFARTGNLPAGHSFAANADRQVLAALGTANTESVMQQLTFNDEAQRRLTGEDLSTIRLGRSGVDMVQGTADDYSIVLNYVGRTSNCDVDIAFDPGAGFAFCQVGGQVIAPNHVRITTADIRMDSNAAWFFSAGPNTQTSITSDSPDPSAPGQAYTVAVSVTKTGSVPSGTPGGMVEIDDGQGASCSLSLNGSGQGSCQLTSSGSGNRTLTANYLGDLGFDASSDTESHGLGVPTTTAILSDLPEPSVVGQPYNVQIQVNGSGGPPTGAFTVSDDAGASCGANLNAGFGVCALTSTQAGTRMLTASYGGNGAFLPSQGSATHLVNKANSNLNINGDAPDPSASGQTITVQWSLSVSSPGAGTPSGSVSISAAGGPESCSAMLPANSCQLALLAPGPRTLTGSYAGDANFNGDSDSENHTVSALASSTQISSDQPDPSALGAAVTVAVQVSAAVGIPAGEVQVSDGNGASCMASLSAGSGSCQLTPAQAGAITLTAAYPGEAGLYLPSGDTEAHQVDGPGDGLFANGFE